MIIPSMNRDRLHGAWNQLRGRLGVSLGALLDNPRRIDASLQRQRLGRAQARRGLSFEQAARQLDEFLKRHHAR